jgi:sulfate transport system ATP-binding protein
MTIELREVLKKFGEQLVINLVSLQVQDGELFVLLGSSGSGKSTILRVIAGLVRPDSGVVLLRGNDVTSLPPQKREAGVVFQNYALFKHMTVAENIEFGLKIRKMPPARRKQRSDELLELVGLSGLAHRYPSQLSGGQSQRVALARALAYEPSVLLLDEPFGALDVKIRGKLRRSLKALQRELGITTVLVTHDQEEAFELADRIAVVERGRIVEVGTPHQLYHSPKTEFVANFVGGGNVLFGRCHEGRVRVGATHLPFPAEAPPHDEGAPVRLLFRPEWVAYGREASSAPDGTVLLGKGTIRDRLFGGAVEKLRFELDDLRGSQSVGLSLEYGQRGTLVDGLASSLAEDIPAIGEERWLSLRRCHVLQPTSLRILAKLESTHRNEGLISTATHLGGASHGLLSLLAIAPNKEEVGESRELLEAAKSAVHTTRRDIRLTTRARIGESVVETVLESQEGYFDLVVLHRESVQADANASFPEVARHVLASARVPVILVSEFGSTLKRVLICTAGGEPGKSDVRLAARIARHTGAFARVFHVRRRGVETIERARIDRHLARAQSVLTSFGVESDVLVAEGDPLKELKRQIEEGQWDLVVIGSSLQAILNDPAKSSFDAQVLASTAIPVLIVPTPE